MQKTTFAKKNVHFFNKSPLPNLPTVPQPSSHPPDTLAPSLSPIVADSPLCRCVEHTPL